MADIKLQITADATGINQKLTSVQNSLSQLQSAAANLPNGLKAVQDSFRNLGNQMSTAVSGTLAAVVSLNTLKEAFNLGSAALKAESAFKSMAEAAKVNADELTEKMKKAADGFVDDSHLMGKAAFALAQDIDPEKIPQLFEAARISARKTGQDVTISIDNMVQAISTNMPKSLRQMGMITKEQMNILNKATAAGIEDVNLLDLVLANAAVDAAKFGDSSENAAKQLKRFRVQVEELKETVGKGLIVGLQRLFGVLQGVSGMALGASINIFKLMQASNELMAAGAEKAGATDTASKWRSKAKYWSDAAGAAEQASNDLYKKSMQNMYGGKGEGDKRSATQKDADITAAEINRQKLMDDLNKRIASAKGGNAAKDLDKLREKWAKIERDLTADIDKAGLSEFEKKIIDIDKKVEDLKAEADKLPTEPERKAAGGNIESWAAEMKGQAESERYKKDLDAQLEAASEGRKALEDLEKGLTASRSSELQKRLTQVDEVAKKESELAIQALVRQMLTEEEYAAKEIEITQVAADQKAKIQADHDKTVRESEINASMAALDLMEKEGLAHRKTLDRRIALVRELIQVEEEHLATMDKSKDEAAWYAQSDKVDAKRSSLAEWTKEKSLTDPFGAMKLAMLDLENKWTDVGQQMYDVATSTAKAMQQAFSDFFFDAFTGKLKSLGDYVTSFCNSVSRAIANALSQQMSAGISTGIGSLFSGGSGAAVSAQGLVAAQVASYGEMAAGWHSGGMGTEPSFFRIVPNLDMLPRYHKGLGPGERLSITTNDEMTLTPGQQKAIWRLAKESGGDAGSPVKSNETHHHYSTTVQMTINALDSRSVAQAIQQHSAQITGIVQQAYNKFGQRGPLGR